MDYWWSLDELIRMNELVIDRPKGSPHPCFPNSVYPLDYGYLKGTMGGDGEGVDVWRGSFDSIKVQASIVTVDLLKACVEVKLIVGCTEKEIEEVLNYHNTFSQSGVLVKRDD